MSAGRVAGRCAEHDDLAWLYGDGSVSCMHCLVVETSSAGCRWVPMPRVWLPKTEKPVHLHRGGTYPWSFCGHVDAQRCDATSIEDTTCGSCRRLYEGSKA